MALRLCSSAGEALPADLGERFTAHFGCEIIDGIGSTEMLHIFLSNLPGKVRYGTTGWPVPGYAVELRGDDGRPVADGETGDLYIQGPTAALLYWGNREKSRETFQGAWTKSGDKYVRNADGSYTYSGRSDDMLKVSGIYVSPFEVEATLVQHPAVLEAAVIGVPDDEGLTRAKAYVVLKPGQHVSDDELKAFVKERLAPYKYPRQIEFIAELPKTATGKIQRFRLRDEGSRGSMSPGGDEFVDIDWAGRRVRIEHQWIARERDASPAGRVPARRPRFALDVEGLSAAPVRRRRLPRAWSIRVRATAAPRRARRRRPGGWTSCTARRTRCCRRCCKRLQVNVVAEPPWLFGHSDGGSIALLYAARFQSQLAGAIVVAPHILVEDLSVRSIAEARRAYLDTDLRERLSRYHDEPDSAFWGWNRIWLHPPFRDWSIEDEIGAITCPLLAVQGFDDEYGTLEQIRGIARRLPQTQLLELAHCGHSPQRDQPEKVIEASVAFIARHGSRRQA